MKKIIVILLLIGTSLLFAACGRKEADAYGDQTAGRTGAESHSANSGNTGSGTKGAEDDITPPGTKDTAFAESRFSGDYRQARELMKNYEYKLIEAINQNDFSIVEPYLLPDSSLYKSQKKLVNDLNQKGIKEKMVSYDVGYLTSENENTYKIEAVESISIDYPDKGEVVKEFQWIYTIDKSDLMKLSDLKAWSTYEEEILQREGSAKPDGYYAYELLNGFDGFFLEELNGSSADLTDKYIENKEVKEELASLMQQLKAKGGNFTIVDSGIRDEIAEENSLEPLTATKLMTLGFADSSNNIKEINVKLTLTIQEHRLDSKLVFVGYAGLIKLKDIELGPVSTSKT